MRIILALCILVAGTMSYAADSGYHVIKKLQLGGEGGWDLLTVDSEAKRLYISRSTHIMVIDLSTEVVLVVGK